MKLNKEEKEILAAYEKGNFSSVPNMKKQVEEYQKHAISTLQKNDSQYKDYFMLAKKILKQSSRLLAFPSLKTNFTGYEKEPKDICTALYVQTVSLLQGIIILCNKGLAIEAAILTRSLIESTAYLLFIAEKNHEERAELYNHSRALSDAVAVRDGNSMAPKGKRKIDESSYEEREREALKFFKHKYGQDKTTTYIKEKCALKPRNAADQLQEDEKQIFIIIYQLLYRPISSVTHGQAPFRFINNKLGTIICCLRFADLLTLFSIKSLTELLSIRENFPVDKLFKEFYSLSNKYENDTCSG